MAGKESKEEMTVLVTGGRQYRDWQQINQILTELSPDRILVGDATGADALALRWAAQNLVACDVFKADWNKHGEAAGPIRNGEMIRAACAAEGSVIVLALAGGIGTENCAKQARAQGLVVLRADPA